MKPQKITAFECPECGGLFEDRENAEDCCPHEAEEVECWKCPMCDEIYDDKESAKECCS